MKRTNLAARAYERNKKKRRKSNKEQKPIAEKKNIHGNKVELKRPDVAEDDAVEPLLGKEEQCRHGEVGL